MFKCFLNLIVRTTRTKACYQLTAFQLKLFYLYMLITTLKKTHIYCVTCSMTPNVLITVHSSMHNNLYNIIIINLLIKFRSFNTAVTDMPNIKPVNLISYKLK